MAGKNFRILTIALIFSAALNVTLLSAFAFYTYQESPISQMVCISRTTAEPTNLQTFRTFSKLTFRELVSYLTNKTLVEEGFAKRDLALATLTAFHHFNLEKALSGLPTQVRTIALSPTETIDLFPGLTEDQYQAIIRYAYQEKWPLTAKGLFTHLQSSHDESLEQAFLVTTEFHALQTLFQKTSTTLQPSTILSLIREGTWALLDQFAREQAQILDFSSDKRRSLLLSYLSNRSPTAAALLLQTDFLFALKRLEDQGILSLLSLLKPSDESSRFCAELLRSPRSDAVLQKAATALYQFTGKAPVESDPKTALAQITSVSAEQPVEQPAKATEPSASSLARYHTVQDGETLWKISRQYKVKVDDVVKLNDLEKDALYPGMTLKIP